MFIYTPGYIPELLGWQRPADDLFVVTEAPAPREAPHDNTTGLSPLAEIRLDVCVGPNAGPGLPRKAVFKRKGRHIAQAAILVALKLHTATAGHLRQFFEREQNDFPVLANDGHHIARHGRAGLGLAILADIKRLLPALGLGDHSVFRNDKASAIG